MKQLLKYTWQNNLSPNPNLSESILTGKMKSFQCLKIETIPEYDLMKIVYCRKLKQLSRSSSSLVTPALNYKQGDKLHGYTVLKVSDKCSAI